MGEVVEQAGQGIGRRFGSIEGAEIVADAVGVVRLARTFGYANVIGEQFMD
jgi:hypothetical protein